MHMRVRSEGNGCDGCACVKNVDVCEGWISASASETRIIKLFS